MSIMSRVNSGLNSAGNAARNAGRATANTLRPSNRVETVAAVLATPAYVIGKAGAAGFSALRKRGGETKTAN